MEVGEVRKLMNLMMLMIKKKHKTVPWSFCSPKFSWIMQRIRVDNTRKRTWKCWCEIWWWHCCYNWRVFRKQKHYYPPTFNFFNLIKSTMFSTNVKIFIDRPILKYAYNRYTPPCLATTNEDISKVSYVIRRKSWELSIDCSCLETNFDVKRNAGGR